jgi:hypothetical protein
MVNTGGVFLKLLDQIFIVKKKCLKVGGLQKPASSAKIEKMVNVRVPVVVLASASGI